MVRMKGQAYILPETLIDILQLLTFVALFVGTFLLFSQWNITIKSSMEDRGAFDFVNVVLGDRCILSEKNGIFLRGILDLEKLKTNSICIQQNKFSFKVNDLKGNSFSFGNCKNEKYYLPILIKDGESFTLGKMVICY